MPSVPRIIASSALTKRALKPSILLAIITLLLAATLHAGVTALSCESPNSREDITLIDPACRSVILTHGHSTQDVYVLLHGLSNGPTQFQKFARLIYKSGANVVNPRMRYHGYRDHMTEAQSGMTAASMKEDAEAALKVAQTLGRRVTVIGLSAGGVTAAWIAQNKPVDRVVLLSPFFSIGFLPDWVTVPSRDIFAVLPNSFIWWDPRQGRDLKGSPYAYPRFSTRAMSQVIRLGTEVFAQARKSPPAAQHIIFFTNPSDIAVNGARTASLEKLWRKRAPEKIQNIPLPKEWHIPHDLIDPWNPDQQTDKVYPVLLKHLGIKAS